MIIDATRFSLFLFSCLRCLRCHQKYFIRGDWATAVNWASISEVKKFSATPLTLLQHSFSEAFPALHHTQSIELGRACTILGLGRNPFLKHILSSGVASASTDNGLYRYPMGQTQTRTEPRASQNESLTPEKLREDIEKANGATERLFANQPHRLRFVWGNDCEDVGDKPWWRAVAIVACFKVQCAIPES